ncbi:MAG TPA: Rieske (2Fe-2S) protein [Alphaproteobacteria bacterium]|nr:Rieske (2Fe-2S) protein [Alphaproteobacteria bacterium]
MQNCPRTMSAETYRDPARFEAERRAIFARSWQFIGHARELSAMGDAISANIAGFPIVAVRAEEGLRAFHNVCRHRAGPLFTQDKGNCGGRLTCAYHGWAYDLEGRLRNARDFGPAQGFDPRDFSLLPVRIAQWMDLLFVHIAEGGHDLEVHLAPLGRRMGDHKLMQTVPAGRRTHDIACNWKIYVENYLEGYHIPSVHPALDAEIDSLKYEVTLEGDVCFHAAPLRDAATQAVYNGLWAFVSPNLGVNVYGHGFMMERVMPLGHQRTRLIYDYYLTSEIARDPVQTEKILNMSAHVTAEDKWICEKVQENIEAGVYDTGVLSPRHEQGVAWFQRRVSAALS